LLAASQCDDERFEPKRALYAPPFVEPIGGFEEIRDKLPQRGIELRARLKQLASGDWHGIAIGSSGPTAGERVIASTSASEASPASAERLGLGATRAHCSRSKLAASGMAVSE
jgi:hypothetical protein